MSQIGEYIPDGLIIDTKISPLAKEVLLKKDQGELKRGTVLGLITTSKLCVPVNSANADGSQEPYCILTDDIDTAQESDVVSTGYFTGIFDKDSLVFGGSDTVETHETKLRDLNIHLK